LVVRRYIGNLDQQLEKINVYYNEVDVIPNPVTSMSQS